MEFTENEQKIQTLIAEGCQSLDKKTYSIEANEKAEALFKKALEIDGTNRKALCGLGMALELQKKWSPALDSYEKVLVGSRGPEDKEYRYALRGKSYVYINQQKFAEAIHILEEYTDLAPRDSRGWFNYGYSLFMLEKYKESDKYFQKFFETNQDPTGTQTRIDAFNYRGFAAYYKNDLEKADMFFEQAFKEDPLSFGAFGARLGGKLVQEKRYFIKQQHELIDDAKAYLTMLLEDFRSGLNIAQFMFIIQFSIGVGLLVTAIALAVLGNQYLLSIIIGGSGAVTTVLSYIHSAPFDIQKNRIDFSQWMIAYFNWINTLTTIGVLISQETKDLGNSSEGKCEFDWTNIAKLQDYLSATTYNTINTIEIFCEPPVTSARSGVQAPTVSSISPNMGNAGTSTTITALIGTNFISGSSVKLSAAGQSDIPATGVTISSPTSISCSFQIPDNAASGQWNVVVTNPDSQSGTLQNGFTINPSGKIQPLVQAPAAVSITPNSGNPGSLVNISALLGTDFVSGSSVKLSTAGQSDIPATGVTVSSPTTLTCDFQIPDNAVPGQWNVVVTNPDSQSGTLQNGFTINAKS